MESKPVRAVKSGAEVRREDDGELIGFVPSCAILDPGDDEHSPQAEGYALSALQKLTPPDLADGSGPVQLRRAGDGELFILEMRAQYSTAKGEKAMQGVRPKRVAMLRESGLPVLVAFGQGYDPDRYKYRWLHDLPDAEPISMDPERMRYGWDTRAWPVGLTLPESIPSPEPRDQEELA